MADWLPSIILDLVFLKWDSSRPNKKTSSPSECFISHIWATAKTTLLFAMPSGLISAIKIWKWQWSSSKSNKSHLQKMTSLLSRQSHHPWITHQSRVFTNQQQRQEIGLETKGCWFFIRKMPQLYTKICLQKLFPLISSCQCIDYISLYLLWSNNHTKRE